MHPSTEVHVETPGAGDSGLSAPTPGRDSLLMLRAALDAVPDAVLVVNPDGAIQLANLQVEHVFGWQPADLEGRRVETLVPDAAREAHPRRRTDCSRRPMGLLQLSAQHRLGHVFPAEISLAPITLADGDPLARRMLDVVSRNAQRELALVSDLLTVALSGAGRLAIAHDLLDLVDLAAEAVTENSAKAGLAGIALRLTQPDERPPAAACLVAGDVGRMRQVLDNLIGNALTFTGDGGVVTVSWSVTGDELCVRVADTGPGIPQDEQPHVFGRMFRGRAAVTGEVEGAGAGTRHLPRHRRRT